MSLFPEGWEAFATRQGDDATNKERRAKKQRKTEK
jgi:hypothetical protein